VTECTNTCQCIECVAERAERERKKQRSAMVAKAARMFDEGVLLKDIAKECGVEAATVGNWMRKIGKQSRLDKRDDDRDATSAYISDELAKGRTKKDIAFELGLHPSTVAQWHKKWLRHQVHEAYRVETPDEPSIRFRYLVDLLIDLSKQFSYRNSEQGRKALQDALDEAERSGLDRDTARAYIADKIEDARHD
jgi:transposase